MTLMAETAVRSRRASFMASSSSRGTRPTGGLLSTRTATAPPCRGRRGREELPLAMLNRALERRFAHAQRGIEIAHIGDRLCLIERLLRRRTRHLRLQFTSRARAKVT